MKLLIALLMLASINAQAAISQNSIERMVAKKYIKLTFDNKGKLLEGTCAIHKFTESQCELVLMKIFEFYNSEKLK